MMTMLLATCCITAAEKPATVDGPQLYKIGDNVVSIQVNKSAKGNFQVVVSNESNTPLRLLWGGEYGDFGIACSYQQKEPKTIQEKVAGDEGKVISQAALLPPKAKLILPEIRGRDVAGIHQVMAIIQFQNGEIYKIWSNQFNITNKASK